MRTVLTVSSTSIQVVRPIQTRMILDCARIAGLEKLNKYQRLYKPTGSDKWVTMPVSLQWSNAINDQNGEKNLLQAIADKFEDGEKVPSLSVLSNGDSLRVATNSAAHECTYEQIQPFVEYLRGWSEAEVADWDEISKQKKKDAIVLLGLYDAFGLGTRSHPGWSKKRL